MSRDTLIDELAQGGAVIKRAKSGRLHTLDVGPLAAELTEEQVAAIAELVDLRRLTLDGASIGDAAIPPLAKLVRLNHLSLQHTRVSDASLPALRAMGHLKFLLLTGTDVSKEGIAELRRAMIGTRIVFL